MNTTTTNGDATNGHVDAAVAAPKLPAHTPAERLAKFDAYEAADSAVSDALAALEAAQEVRAQKIHEIAITCGCGPFEWNGAELTVAKNKQGKFSFRRRGQKEVIRVA
jgi:hypothetical protein